MTFNTTSLRLRQALEDKRLLVRMPPRPLGASIRYVLLTPDLDAMLDGHLHFGAFPQAEADRLIARFSANWLVSVSNRKQKDRANKKDLPDIERLAGFDEVWCLCPRKPRPGWRILGRFHAKNVFIGTRAWDKHVLVKRYQAAADEVIEDWQELFPDEGPHRGASWADYVGEAYIDVDQAN